MKILFTGGGTGGHVFPIIAIVRELRRSFPSKKFKFFYLGPRDVFAKILLSQEGIKVKTILAGKLRRYLHWKAILQNIVDVLIKIPVGALQSFFQIFILAPDLIFSKGGYGAFSSGISGWILQTPIFLHESDIVPGLSNRILSKFCSKLFTAFPRTEYFPKEKIIVVGNPLRRELLKGSKEQAKKLFELKGARPVILILGGSQGAKRINETILSILKQLLANFEVIHQVGDKNIKKVKAEVQALIKPELRSYYHCLGFLREEQLKQAYAICDLIVSRAGAGAIFEIAALAKPSILIPLPESAQNHQIENAYAFASLGATVVMEEANVSSHFFLEKIKFLFSHQDELDKMTKNAKSFAKPEAVQKIAKEIVGFLA